MPLPALLAAAQIAGPVIQNQQNAASTMEANMQNQQFSYQMYQRQRQDAIDFWNMQNQYNSPAAQMERFKAAGLNPNLIYGRGDSGSASPIPVPDAQHVDFRAPQYEGMRFDLLGQMNAFADLDIKRAQADNLRAQNSVIIQEGILKGLNSQRLDFDLGLDRDMRETSADYRRAQLQKLQSDIDVQMNRDAREAVQNATSVQEAYTRMRKIETDRLNVEAQTAKTYAEKQEVYARIRESWARHDDIRKSGVLKDIEIRLRNAGVNPNDPMWQRYLGMMLDGLIREGSSYFQNTPTRR